ncbi:co-regulatory protein PtrA N-terminal domain-containing protein, partial [Pseudomonas aeruginosa]
QWLTFQMNEFSPYLGMTPYRPTVPIRMQYMKPLKVIFAIATLAASSLAMAESGGDRTFAKMELARQTSSGATLVAQKSDGSAPAAELQRSAIKHEKC